MPGAHASCGGTRSSLRGQGKKELLYRRLPLTRQTNLSCVLPFCDAKVVRMLAHHDVPLMSSSSILTDSTGVSMARWFAYDRTTVKTGSFAGAAISARTEA